MIFLSFIIIKPTNFRNVSLQMFELAVLNVIKEFFAGLVLKEQQLAALKEIVVNCNDVFALLPTGFGNSTIFTMLPLLLDNNCSTSGYHKVIVVSPLVALRSDQIVCLTAKGIKAVHLAAEVFNEGKQFDVVSFIKPCSCGCIKRLTCN